MCDGREAKGRAVPMEVDELSDHCSAARAELGDPSGTRRLKPSEHFCGKQQATHSSLAVVKRRRHGAEALYFFF